MNAIIEAGGKQYRVTWVTSSAFPTEAEAGAEITLGKVLAVP